MTYHWDIERFTVTSPKTERYGKASRVVPIFPELRSFLDNGYSMAQEGDTWVVPMLGGNIKKNIATRFKKIIKRAGVEVWPKPFQNLRASRQTELERQHPTFVVCKWIMKLTVLDRGRSSGGIFFFGRGSHIWLGISNFWIYPQGRFFRWALIAGSERTGPS